MKINDKNALDVLKKEFSDLGPEIIDNFRRKYQQHVDEAVEDVPIVTECPTQHLIWLDTWSFTMNDARSKNWLPSDKLLCC